MERSAIFTPSGGNPIWGQLTTKYPEDPLAFVANEGTVYGLAQLRKGEVTILVDAGREPSAEVRQLQEKATLLGIKVVVGGRFKFE